MPLNVQNKTYVTVDDGSKEPPTPRPPIKHTPFLKYFVLGLFIVIVVSSSVFLVFIYLVGRQGTMLPSKEIATTQNVETQSPVTNQTVEPEVKPAPVSQQQQLLSAKAYYTIYIAAYVIEPPADDDVSRWNDAGYISSVVEANKYYNVALGQYATVEEARKFAEEMFDAFENGYFIGKIK